MSVVAALGALSGVWWLDRGVYFCILAAQDPLYVDVSAAQDFLMLSNPPESSGTLAGAHQSIGHHDATRDDAHHAFADNQHDSSHPVHDPSATHDSTSHTDAVIDADHHGTTGDHVHGGPSHLQHHHGNLGFAKGAAVRCAAVVGGIVALDQAHGVALSQVSAGDAVFNTVCASSHAAVIGAVSYSIAFGACCLMPAAAPALAAIATPWAVYKYSRAALQVWENWRRRQALYDATEQLLLAAGDDDDADGGQQFVGLPQARGNPGALRLQCLAVMQHPLEGHPSDLYSSESVQKACLDEVCPICHDKLFEQHESAARVIAFLNLQTHRVSCMHLYHAECAHQYLQTTSGPATIARLIIDAIIFVLDGSGAYIEGVN
eukprot:jgi/Chlat1/4258/Chrsp279S04225